MSVLVAEFSTYFIKGCICKDLGTDFGYSNCIKEEPGGKSLCYVTLPSSCSDLKRSRIFPGEMLSHEPCGMLISYMNFYFFLLSIRMSSSHSSVHILYYLFTECPNDEAKELCHGPNTLYAYGVSIFTVIVIIIGIVVVLYIIRKRRSFQNSSENLMERRNTLKCYPHKGMFT